MSDDPACEHLLAGAPALTGVPAAWWGDGVRTHLRLTLALAATLRAFPLPDEIDPATVFRA